MTATLETLSHAEYLAHPALSRSGAKLLLPPSCPAKFKHNLTQPSEPTDQMDLGSAAHRLVLGTGTEIVEVEADSWRTKDAREAKDAARTAGKVPLLTKDLERVRAMAEAARSHRLVAAMMDGSAYEQAIVWDDAEHGVQRKAALDILPAGGKRPRLILADYKTAQSASPDAFARAVASYGYHMQDRWYADAAVAAELDDDPAFLFLVQETTPPYLIAVYELDAGAKALGAALNDRAIRTYAECVAADSWPGYSDDIETLSLPYWALREAEEML